ncbi:MAG: protein translocase subunit SecF [SAR324 cluster bacterium]|nr:protein translocase subunit SecF [SAR324 cluster bacterium]
MELFKDTLNLDFVGKYKMAMIFSGIVILASLVSIFLHKGLNYGIDFRGGTNVQIRLGQTYNLDEIRTIFSSLNIGEVMLQTFGDEENNEILLLLPVDSVLGTGEELTGNIQKYLGTQYPQMEIRRIESIGPKVGDELKASALDAILVALGLVLIYISFRFEWRFAVGAIAALVHDICFVVGVFSFFEHEITLTIVAALLTVVGYSLNDTIVIFDRVRENQARFRKRELSDLINLSTNETMSRTILTSGTTLLVVATLYAMGGEIIHDFALALLVGIVSGTYSTIYIASPCLLWLNRVVPQKSEQKQA